LPSYLQSATAASTYQPIGDYVVNNTLNNYTSNISLTLNSIINKNNTQDTSINNILTTIPSYLQSATAASTYQPIGDYVLNNTLNNYTSNVSLTLNSIISINSSCSDCLGPFTGGRRCSGRNPTSKLQNKKGHHHFITVVARHGPSGRSGQSLESGTRMRVPVQRQRNSMHGPALTRSRASADIPGSRAEAMQVNRGHLEKFPHGGLAAPRSSVECGSESCGSQAAAESRNCRTSCNHRLRALCMRSVCSWSRDMRSLSGAGGSGCRMVVEDHVRQGSGDVGDPNSSPEWPGSLPKLGCHAAE
jgi:hypothetical protein